MVKYGKRGNQGGSKGANRTGKTNLLMLVPVVKMLRRNLIVQERKNMEDTNLDLGVDFRFYGLMV